MYHVASAICELAVHLRAHPNVSFVERLRQIRPKGSPVVTESELASVLRQRPELIHSWFGYSEDQRCADAWYLVSGTDPSGSGAWIVGNPASHKRLAYADLAAACAAFIARTVGEPAVKASFYGS